MAKRKRVVKAETESFAVPINIALEENKRPLPSDIVETLKKTLTIKDKMNVLDWGFLIAGIGGGLYSDHWEDTVTLAQLFDILTDGLNQSDFDDVLSSIDQADGKEIQSGGKHV